MNPETFTPYDSADYLKTPEQIAGYLAAAIEGGGADPEFMVHVRDVVARAEAAEIQTRRQLIPSNAKADANKTPGRGSGTTDEMDPETM